MADKLTVEEQIAVMLRKAETTSPEEAEMIMARVEKLMLRHGVDKAVADLKNLGTREAEKIVQEYLPFTGSYADAYMRMAYAIISGMGGLNGIGSGQGSRRYLIVVGFESDVAQAKTLVESLQLQCVVAVSAFVKEQTAGGYWKFHNASQKFQAKRSFIMGFGAGAGRRIAANKLQVVKEADAAVPGSSVAVQNRALAVKSWVSDNMDTRKGRGTKIVGGYTQGVAAGRNADTGDKRIAQPKELGR